MTPLFKKLHLGDARVAHVLNAPASIEPELSALEQIEIRRSATGPIGFALAFVTTCDEVERATEQLTLHAVEDATLWMAYPKGTSKNYRCELNRDTGWASLGAAGYEPVRQVAIDEDWSALRFRQVAHIKTMTRDPEGAISSAGKSKARAHRGG